MKLTDKEKEIMTVLWKSEIPMTTTEIVEASPSRTWKDVSIYIMLKSLQAKEAVVIDNYRPTVGRAAATYKPVITPAEYAALQALEMDVDIGDFLAAFADRKNNKPEDDN